MQSNVSLSTDYSRLYMFVASAPPDGVEIKSSAPPFTKGFDLSVEIDINIVVDLTKIAAVAFSVWLADKLASASRNRRINVAINGKHIPEIEADAVKLITCEVENNAQNDSADGDASGLS